MTIFEVTAPDEGFNGEVGGVRFDKGTATVDDADAGSFAALSYFRNTDGYKVAANGGTDTGGDGDGDLGEVKRPANTAAKPDWVAYAVALGADEAEAKDTNKDVLIAKYGG